MLDKLADPVTAALGQRSGNVRVSRRTVSVALNIGF